MTAIWSRPRETVEVMPLSVTVDGDPDTTFDVAVTPKYGARPTSWVAATISGGQSGVSVVGLEPGDYWAFAKVDGAVLDPVWFRIT